MSSSCLKINAKTLRRLGIGGSLIPETLENVNYEFLQIINGCRKAFQKNYKARKDGIRRSEFEVGR